MDIFNILFNVQVEYINANTRGRKIEKISIIDYKYYCVDCRLTN